MSTSGKEYIRKSKYITESQHILVEVDFRKSTYIIGSRLSKVKYI